MYLVSSVVQQMTHLYPQLVAANRRWCGILRCSSELQGSVAALELWYAVVKYKDARDWETDLNMPFDLKKTFNVNLKILC